MEDSEWKQLLFAAFATVCSVAGGIFLLALLRSKKQRFRNASFWADASHPQIVYQVAYRSRLNKSCDAQALIERTKEFRLFNKLHGITGVMFINSEVGEVFQTIEGPHDAVLDLFDRICRDRMHIVDRSRIVHEPFAVRNYSMWNMACHNFPMVDTMNSSLLWGCLMSRTKMNIMDPDWDNTAIPPLMDTFWITSRADPDVTSGLPFHTIPNKISDLTLNRINKSCTFTVVRKEDGSRPDFLNDLIYSGDVTISFLPKFANEHFQKYYEFKHGRTTGAGGKVHKWYEGEKHRMSEVKFQEAGFLFSPIKHNGRQFVGVFPASKSFFGTVKSCQRLFFHDRCVKQDLVTITIRAVGLDDHIPSSI